MRAIKYFTLISTLSLSLFANEASIKFYNASQENELMCKITVNSYAKISQKNSSIVIVNNTSFFKLKNKNQYISSSACHAIKKHSSGIIF